MHEDITESALSFLRSGVLDDMVDEHSEYADDDEGASVPWIHADGCAFGETVQQINVLQDEAARELVPGTGFEPWSGSDHFGLPLHPAQDFYSHSNWVELGFPVGDDPTTVDVVEGLDTTDLVNFSTTFAGTTGLGPWGAPPPLGVVRGDILLDDLVVSTLHNPDGVGLLEPVGEPVIVEIPSHWNIGLLPHPDPARSGQAWFVPGIDVGGAIPAVFSELDTPGPFTVPVIESGAEYRFLISGIGGRPVDTIYGNQCDPYRRDADGEVVSPLQLNSCWPPLTLDVPPVRLPDDYSCIAYYGSDFALTHSGTARSELNKDTASAAPTRHPRARALATLQTQYEWCRFVNLAGQAGSDGVALALWVDDNEPPHPVETPCGPGDADGPLGVTVSVDNVEVINDGDIDEDEPGEINLSLVLYDDPADFHRSVKTDSGPVYADDDGSGAPQSLTGSNVPGPVSMCVSPGDTEFRVALHGWDDDEGDDDGAEPDANGDFDQHGTSPGPANVDDALVGFSATHLAPAIPVGSSTTVTTTSDDLHVTYTVARVPDTDGDGLDACGEPFYGTDHANPDSDEDGISDGIEVQGANPTNPLAEDSDGDGLTDGGEDANANGQIDPQETNPNSPDTDGDGLTDGIETGGANPTNPLVADTDGDGLTDGQEDANTNGTLDAEETDPNDSDTDDDGLTDGQEVELATDPLDADSDDDGVLDGNDPDWLIDAINAVPPSAFKSPAEGSRTAILNQLEQAESLIQKDNIKTAHQKLTSVRARIDGCGPSADGNDWILDCTAQTHIRKLLDLLLADTAS